ncbi:unnamed protein product, partial [Allacma fusca]
VKYKAFKTTNTFEILISIPLPQAQNNSLPDRTEIRELLKLLFRQSMDTIKGKLLKSCFSSMPVLNAQENILRSKLAAAPSCKGLTIPELIRSQTGNWGNRTAYECAVTGLKFTHNEVHKYSKGFGAALLKLGLKRGDVAIILLPNCPQYAPVLQGMLDTGIIAAPMNPALTTCKYL